MLHIFSINHFKERIGTEGRRIKGKRKGDPLVMIRKECIGMFVKIYSYVLIHKKDVGKFLLSITGNRSQDLERKK